MRRSVCAGHGISAFYYNRDTAVSGRKLFMEIDYPVYPDAQQQKEAAINNPIKVNDFRQIIFIVEYLEIVCSI